MLIAGVLSVGMNNISSVYAATESTNPMKSMNKRYSTSIGNAVLSGNDEIAETECFYFVKPKLKGVNVRYDNKKIIITGTAQNVDEVTADYNNKKEVVKVKSGKFKVVLDYKKAKNIKLYGSNKKHEKITKNKIVKSEDYVTEKPECTSLVHNKKGVTCNIRTEAGSMVVIKYEGKVLKKQVVDSSSTKIFISENKFKKKGGSLVITQKNTNKKVSEKAVYQIGNVGENISVSY